VLVSILVVYGFRLILFVLVKVPSDQAPHPDESESPAAKPSGSNASLSEDSEEQSIRISAGESPLAEVVPSNYEVHGTIAIDSDFASYLNQVVVNQRSDQAEPATAPGKEPGDARAVESEAARDRESIARHPVGPLERVVLVKMPCGPSAGEREKGD